jgi:ribose/xylose/arabinose/galactoside ABC-type transport system permease subunit
MRGEGKGMNLITKPLWRMMKQNPQFIILLIVIIFMIFSMPEFKTFSNVMNVLKQSTVLMLLSCGMTFVVITGNLDLSMGSMLSLLLCTSMRLQPHNILLAIVVPILISIFFGMINGFIVGRFNVNSVIVTLAMMSVLDGITMLATRGEIANGIQGTGYSYLGTRSLFNIPLYVLLAIVFAVFTWFLLKKTTFGKFLYYLGVNKDAAIIAGVNSKKIMLIAYVISGFAVSLATLVLGSRLLAATAVSGKGYEFNALTAILVGGVKLTGGKGSMLNTIIGVILITTVINGLTLLKVSYEYQNIAKGILVFIAILSESKTGASYER